MEIAKIQSTESSNEIEGIRTTNFRLQKLVNKKITPKNRDEEEIAGYRDALNIIHENYEYIPIKSSYILQLHQILYSHSTKSIGGKFKSVQNYISGTDANGKMYTIFVPLSPVETPIAIEKICFEFEKITAENCIDPLILIPIFIHDFLCIHPFLDGNGRISRLLTTLLLYKFGYFIGKYTSLETEINKTKNFYYDALEQSQKNWHNAKDNPKSFIKYLLKTIIFAYKNLEEKVKNISSNNLAINIVKNAIKTNIGKFTKSQIAQTCPNLSIKSVENSIKKLVNANVLEKHSKGKNTFYTIKNNDFFN